MPHTNQLECSMTSYDDAGTLTLVGGTDYKRLRLDIPREHRGIRFERIFENNHPQETTRLLEIGFVEEWSQRNGQGILQHILSTRTENPQSKRLPQTPREWEVAELVAASIIQWLPSATGCSFLDRAFVRGGGKFNYTLPKC